MSDLPDGDGISNQDPNAQQPNQNGLKALETVRQFLEEDDWHPEQLSNHPEVFRVLFAGRHGESRSSFPNPRV